MNRGSNDVAPAEARDLVITNLDHGQTIRVEVGCMPGSAGWRATAEQLLKLVRIRQPSVLRLEWPPGVHPASAIGYVEAIDEALQDVGGALVTPDPPPESST